VASPFGCRSGHIPLSRKPPCPGTGRLARASALLLMHRQRNHNDPRRSTYFLQQRSQTVKVVALSVTDFWRD
jgi:hypothetical protein